MLHQRLPNRVVSSLYLAENTWVQFTTLNSFEDGLRNDVCRAGVRDVPPDDNRTPRSKRRRGVASRCREGQRKIGGTKYGDRSNGALDQL
ncbi:hypothetical protein Q669_29120 [Labrenzia sp. C1B10]|nr:hypothetical protein Q669_29120 [Labrenzia sp. C1B10]ERS06952.1 hypothetical protein Q675_24980 [Labrenzia sp. C1B70]